MFEAMEILSGHVVFAGGGTAGHLFPGLAVAEQLLREAPALRITFAGTGRSFERRHVARAGYEYLALAGRPFPRRARDAFRFVADNVSGYYAARRFLREENVTLVVGLGGYASVPAVQAAASLRTPVVLLEQNAVPGRATRWLSGSAECVCSSFEGIRSHLRAHCRVRVTGNPLRREFIECDTPQRYLSAAPGAQRRLLVLGGSGGSHTLNERVPLALYKAKAALANWQIVHQSGEREAAAVAQLYCKLGIAARVVPFIDELPKLLRASDLAISRSGGTTLAELAASGLPAILLPYPAAADDHQRKNAEVYCHAGGCALLDERELDGRLDNHLADAVSELAGAHRIRVRMAQAMQRLARPDATQAVVRTIGSLFAGRSMAAV